MHKSEIKVSIRRTTHGVSLFLSDDSLSLIEKSSGIKQAYFLTFWLIFKTFLKRYPAKSEIKGLTERKKRVVLIFYAQVAMPCVLKENYGFRKCPFFEIFIVFYFRIFITILENY